MNLRKKMRNMSLRLPALQANRHNDIKISLFNFT